MKPLDSVSVKTDHESQTISNSHLLTSVDRQLGRRVPYGANRMDHWQRKWGSDSGIIQSRHSRLILPITRSQWRSFLDYAALTSTLWSRGPESTHMTCALARPSYPAAQQRK
jgi:hypothetical protein